MMAIPITVRGAELLKAELKRLKSVDRPAVVQAIKEAREKGDLSENAEYDAAKELQGHIEGRIAELEGKLSSLQVIDPKELDAGGRVVFGATVELEDQDTGNVVSYQIVGDDEGDIKRNLVSISSPIARALIGKFEGDEVTVHAPAGDRYYDILSVQYI
ncbi:MAG: transcription elongation factor GreA [Burkholderiaceae bacterium]|nr:transcription elongation factor GreA [Burkholderiaceae bacterium]MBQ5767043.1 transcription elongation factor GreA [Burkholderiaceae bacterium]